MRRVVEEREGDRGEGGGKGREVRWGWASEINSHRGERLSTLPIFPVCLPLDPYNLLASRWGAGTSVWNYGTLEPRHVTRAVLHPMGRGRGGEKKKKKKKTSHAIVKLNAGWAGEWAWVRSCRTFPGRESSSPVAQSSSSEPSCRDPIQPTAAYRWAGCARAC